LLNKLVFIEETLIQRKNILIVLAAVRH